MPLSRAHRVLMLLLSPDHASPLSHLSVPLAGPHASPAGLPTNRPAPGPPGASH